MLRISHEIDQGWATLELEGRLAGPWVDELRRCWQQIAVPGSRALLLDLKTVSFVDEAGQALLREMREQGVRLVGRGPMIRHLVEQIESESPLNSV